MAGLAFCGQKCETDKITPIIATASIIKTAVLPDEKIGFRIA
jgi:hypothetical protein